MTYRIASLSGIKIIFKTILSFTYIRGLQGLQELTNYFKKTSVLICKKMTLKSLKIF